MMNLRGIVFASVVLSASLQQHAWGTAPNPLQSAYWRFEEGSHNASVDSAVADPVKDSINANHLDAFSAAAAPTYTNSSVPPTALKSGLTNTLALDFIRSPGANDDLFSLFMDGEYGKGLGKQINNGIIAAGGGFTVEAAFNTTDTTQFQAIVGKEGRPGLGKLGGAFVENLQTFVVKTRGDNQLLQVEMWDGGAVMLGEQPAQVSSLAAIIPGQWYYFAAVGTDTELSLYLDSNDGQGYLLQGTVALNGGALYQGDDPLNPSWDNSWTVGRGQFGGGAADWFDGQIDEVRLTNAPLSPSQFLFAPPSTVLDGDYNENDVVDAADYTVWRDHLGDSNSLPNDQTPGVTQDDYTVWKQNFGQMPSGAAAVAVPEPAVVSVLLVTIAWLATWRVRSL